MFLFLVCLSERATTDGIIRETQNWGVSQSSTGLLYVANNDGILEFDGSFWRKLPHSVQVISRSVLARQQGVHGRL